MDGVIEAPPRLRTRAAAAIAVMPQGAATALFAASARHGRPGIAYERRGLWWRASIGGVQIAKAFRYWRGAS